MTVPFVLLLALAGCTGSSDVAPAPDVAPEAGWLSTVAQHPERFSSTMEKDGTAWVLFHSRRDADAWASATPGSHLRGRAAWSLAVLHDDLSRLTGLVHDALYTEWDARSETPGASGLPEGSAAPVVAVLAAACTGQGDATRWLERARVAPGGDLAIAAASGEIPWARDLGPPDHPWIARAGKHRAAREGFPEALSNDVAPAVTEPAEGFERRLWDPCVHRTLSEIWLGRALQELGPAGGPPAADWRAASLWADPDDLGGLLMSPWLTPQDLTVDLQAVDRPGLVGRTAPSAGLPALSSVVDRDGADDHQAARDNVAALDARIAGWQAQLASAGTPDGRQILGDLHLLERWRQELLVVRARDALVGGRPRQALALLQLARDVAIDEVGLTNSPQVYALLAEAEIRTGRTREALDTLQPLVGPFPEVRALIEVTGDLAVLRGLDRQGDSKEE